MAHRATAVIYSDDWNFVLLRIVSNHFKLFDRTAQNVRCSSQMLNDENASLNIRCSQCLQIRNSRNSCHTILIIGKRFRAADFLAKFGQTIANVHSVLDALNR